MNYYNEFDKHAAAWLRELIKAGHIAPGIVDERSIEDVRPDELRDFTQCHFFAGIGVWSYALRRAGWDDTRPVWTGSCPCQPFSAAGKGNGFADERHLWPAFYHLIDQCRPANIFGEQVASKAVEPWIDLVHADLEALGYAFGCVPFPTAGVGGPHIRDRAYWVADTRRDHDAGEIQTASAGQQEANRPANIACGCGCASCGLADAVGRVNQPCKPQPDQWAMARGDGALQAERTIPSPTNGLWRDADWLFCRDGKWRPVEPGTFPLVNGAPARVGRLRAYGNSINAKAGEVFIRAVMESIDAY